MIQECYKISTRFDVKGQGVKYIFSRGLGIIMTENQISSKYRYIESICRKKCLSELVISYQYHSFTECCDIRFLKIVSKALESHGPKKTTVGDS